MVRRPTGGPSFSGVRAVLGLVAACIAAGCATPGSTRAPSQVASALEAVVAGREGVAAAGVVVVRIDGQGREFAAAHGCARFTADGARCVTPLSAEHWMRVASISKLFVAAAALQLVDAGKLSLDGDIQEVLGYPVRNSAHPNEPITLRQLLGHTSTLRDGARYSIAPPGTLRDLLGEPGRFAPEHPPGRHFQYANVNFPVLAALIERSAGMRFDQYVNQFILRPAGIRAGFNWSQIEDAPLDKVAVLYRKREPDSEIWDATLPWRAQVDAFDTTVRSPKVPEPYELGSNSTLFSPQGGLRIQPQAVARFTRLLLDPAAPTQAVLGIRPETRALLCRPVYGGSDAAITGDAEAGLYGAFGVGAQPKSMANREWCGHFAEAYGLKGGALHDSQRHETIVYFVTGYAAAPPAGDGRYPGLDALEAAAFDIAMELTTP